MKEYHLNPNTIPTVSTGAPLGVAPGPDVPGSTLAPEVPIANPGDGSTANVTKPVPAFEQPGDPHRP